MGIRVVELARFRYAGWKLFDLKMSLSSKLFLRSFSSSSALQNAIKNVTVIGGGLMGAGIAQVSVNLKKNLTNAEVKNCNVVALDALF